MRSFTAAVLAPPTTHQRLRNFNVSLGYDNLFVLAWFVASAATVGGALGSGLESDEAIRAVAYFKGEEERRNLHASDRNETLARAFSRPPRLFLHDAR